MAVYFVFCIHNHQPVGNFGFVMEEAYQKAYDPFLKVLSRKDSARATLHYSGVLYQWLEKNHPDFLERLSSLAARGKIELMAGGFYEPILAIIPEKDRLGQLRKMADYIEDKFGQVPAGMWLTERVWEPHLPKSIVDAGLEYIVVDDFHLRAAGAREGEISEPYLTGDGESVVTVVGGSERLRYLIPFEDPQKTIDHLKKINDGDPSVNHLVSMADDGEKLGIWPGTHQLVYHEGWLESFFDLVDREKNWLKMVTCREALEKIKPKEPLYLPTMSYMEMSEWTLRPESHFKYEAIKNMLSTRKDLGYTRHLLRGGFWRNFLTKYPESRYLVGRMYYLSRKINALADDLQEDDSQKRSLAENALDELWRGQCNDAYWHGVFGGLYLPFLRAAVCEHLIGAETLSEQVETGGEGFAFVDTFDLDGDGRKEIILKNRELTLTVDPSSGLIMEVAFKPARINLANSLNRREESYHAKALTAPAQADDDGVHSIHDFEGVRGDNLPISADYDQFPRRFSVDHVWRGGHSFEEWRQGLLPAEGAGEYEYEECRWEVDGAGITLNMVSPGRGDDWPAVDKSMFVARDSARVKIDIRFNSKEGFPPFYAGQEFNLTPTSLDESEIKAFDRHGREAVLSDEGRSLSEITKVVIQDRLKKVLLTFEVRDPHFLWYSPIRTLSASEAGYEQNFQQIALLFWKDFRGVDIPREEEIIFEARGLY